MAFGNRTTIGERESTSDPENRGSTSVITRRHMILTLGGAACAKLLGGAEAWAQGISSRGVKAQPRGKPSGRPFRAHFTDVAHQAGLTQPIIYGGLETKSYIIEVVGCGIAFLDYDN